MECKWMASRKPLILQSTTWNVTIFCQNWGILLPPRQNLYFKIVSRTFKSPSIVSRTCSRNSFAING